MSIMDNTNLLAALPEIVLLVGACVVIMADVLQSETRRISIDRLALGVLLFPLLATLWQWDWPAQYAFSGMYVLDDFSKLLKLCSYGAVAVTIVYARRYDFDRGLRRGEFYGLALFALLGQMVMISASSMLSIYMGLEMMSLSFYAMCGLRQDTNRPVEAAMKYFVLGALASGFLLYGMSMLYGAAGDLSLAGVARAFDDAQTNSAVLTFGTVFIVAGLAFKLGAVPFHMWLPDVYHGAPTTVTLFIAGASKLASFAIAFRLLVEALLSVAVDWQQMLVVLTVLSLAIGNVVAIAQTNFKRMLAYSTISHVGFVLMGLLSGVVPGREDLAAEAYSSALFYMLIYVLTTLGTFGMIQLLARKGFECEEIADLRGLNRRSPLMAGVLLVLMFSLTGIPPTAGFVAKLAVLEAAVDAGHVWLAVFAVMMSLVGAFYYIRVVKVAYFEEPVGNEPVLVDPSARVLFGLNGAAVLLLGIVPDGLIAVCLEVIRQALAT
jgi:NADH-quinone oxidoreductase subunit N